jgi:Zn-dependent alcohol dehydrogenase
LKTRAAVLLKPGTEFLIEELDLEPPRAGEVLVRVKAAGICHSDWNLVSAATRHPFPVVAGHEGAGIVEAVGEGVTRLHPGDFVALNWAPSCGHCFYCLNDRPSLCETTIEPIWAGLLMDSSTRLARRGDPVYHFSGLACFADHAVVPERSCVPLPGGVPAAIAALIGCAVTTGVGAVVRTARLQPGATVAVFGAGGVGLSVILGAKLAGARQIIAVDRTEEKSRMALDFGATHALANGKQTTEEIRALTGGRGADVVFEAVGSPPIQEACLGAVRPGGELVLVGLSPMGTETNFPSALLTRQEKRVTGCYYGSADPDRDFPWIAQLYLDRKLDLDRLVSKTFDLEEINQAYRDLLDGKLARGVILF